MRTTSSRSHSFALRWSAGHALVLVMRCTIQHQQNSMHAAAGKDGTACSRHRYAPKLAPGHQLACAWGVQNHAGSKPACCKARAAVMHRAVHQHLDIYAISDLHVDHDGNMQWLQEHIQPQQFGPGAVLIVAGDISDSLEKVREVLQLLKAAFWQVLFVPGNHELWVKGPAASQNGAGAPLKDSLHKLSVLQDTCRELGVHTQPVRFGQLVIAPILSWHHQSWDQEPDIPEGWVPKASALTISDYARCIWPEETGRTHGSIDIAELLDSLNPPILDQLHLITASHNESDSNPQHARAAQPGHTEPNSTDSTTADSNQHSNGSSRTIEPAWSQAAHGSTSTCSQGTDEHAQFQKQAASTTHVEMATAASQPGGVPKVDLITFSHFLTSQYLLPEKRFLTFPSLAKAVGSQPLHRRVKQLRPVVHVFGHTHFAWDAVPPDSAGVRHIQAPLCYPAERARRMRSIAMQLSADWPTGTTDAPTSQLGWLPLLLARAHYTLKPAPYTAANDGDAGGSTTSSQQQTQDAVSPAAQHVLARLPCLILEQQQQQQQQHSQQQGEVGIRQPQEADTTLSQGTQQSLEQQAYGQEPATGLGTQQAAACSWELRDWQLKMCPELSAMWSDHYKSHPREPENTQLAPWVAHRYARRLARSKQTVPMTAGAARIAPESH